MIWGRCVRASLAAALAVCALVALWLSSKCWRTESKGCVYWRPSRAIQGVHDKGGLGGSSPPTAIATPREKEDMAGQPGNASKATAEEAAIVVEEAATTRKRAIAVSISIQVRVCWATPR